MNIGAEWTTKQRIGVENIVAKHLDLIKSGGKRGRSAMADVAYSEEVELPRSNPHSILKAEYFILRTLTQAMREELRRMEEKKS